jgi:hypothetical protein
MLYRKEVIHHYKHGCKVFTALATAHPRQPLLAALITQKSLPLAAPYAPDHHRTVSVTRFEERGEERVHTSKSAGLLLCRFENHAMVHDVTCTPERARARGERWWWLWCSGARARLCVRGGGGGADSNQAQTPTQPHPKGKT